MSVWDLLNFFVSFAKLGKFLPIISYYVISKKLCLLVYLWIWEYNTMAGTLLVLCLYLLNEWMNK